MPHKKPPRHLQDFSHLFFSGHADRDKATGMVSEAVIHVAVLGGTCARAYIAAGIASAFVSEHVQVTLLETGCSLPNAGYYYALEPREYLSPTLGGVRGISYIVDNFLRYSYCIRPGDLETFSTPFSVPGRVQIILNVFDSTSMGRDLTMPAELCRGPERFTKEGRTGNGKKNALVVFQFVEVKTGVAHLLASFHGSGGDGPVFLVESGMKSGNETNPEPGGVYARHIDLPPDFLAGLARRTPPASPFFKGVAASLIQAILFRKKGKTVDAAI